MVIRAGNQIQSGPGRGGRVVEGAALEKRYTFTGIVGSNPTLSATHTCLTPSTLVHCCLFLPHIDTISPLKLVLLPSCIGR